MYKEMGKDILVGLFWFAVIWGIVFGYIYLTVLFPTLIPISIFVGLGLVFLALAGLVGNLIRNCP